MADVTDETYVKMCAPYVTASKKDETQDALDNAAKMFPKFLNEAGLTDDTVANLVNIINETNSDNLNGNRQRNLNNLLELWENAQRVEETAKIKEIIAARNYYHETTNPQKNWKTNFKNNYINYEIDNQWQKLIGEFYNAVLDISNTFNNLNSNYNMILNVDNNMENLITTNSDQLKTIIKNINNYKSLTNVDTRKNFYQYQEQNYYNSIYYYLKICYYGLLVIYIFFGDFIAKSRYKDYRFYIFLIIYIIFPYLIKYIFAYIAYAYDYLLKYFNIKKPVYSYSDIIRANNINDIYTAPTNTVNNPINSNNYISNSQMERIYNQYVVNSNV